MNVTFEWNNKKKTIKIDDEKNIIYQILELEKDLTDDRVFDVDLAFNKRDNETDEISESNKECVTLALDYLYDQKLLYKRIKGLEFLGLIEQNSGILSELKDMKIYPDERFSPYISSLIMECFGAYKTLLMISEGLKLSYEGKLDASSNDLITDDLIEKCKNSLNISGLNASNNPNITTIDFCVDTLEELDVSGEECVLDYSDISNAIYLKKLNISDNSNITTVNFCAATLEELIACGDCGLDEDGFCEAIHLKKLNISDNSNIETIDFCADNLEELDASGLDSKLDDDGIKSAIHLKRLNVSNNQLITSIDFCAETLEELDASTQDCQIMDEGIFNAIHLKILDVSDNEFITSVDFCAETLQELHACGEDCGLDDKGISKAIHLRKLHSCMNPKITIPSFSKE